MWKTAGIVVAKRAAPLYTDAIQMRKRSLLTGITIWRNAQKMIPIECGCANACTLSGWLWYKIWFNSFKLSINQSKQFKGVSCVTYRLVGGALLTTNFILNWFSKCVCTSTWPFLRENHAIQYITVQFNSTDICFVNWMLRNNDRSKQNE